jgi:hypothetical protein
MKLWRIALAMLVLLGVLAGAALLFRESIVNLWIGKKLAGVLSAAVRAEVELEDVAWTDGTLRAGRGVISGGALPFASLEVSDLRTAVGWDQLFDPLARPLHVETGAAEIVWPGESKRGEDRPKSDQGTRTELPPVDLLVARLTMRHADGKGWSVRDTAARAVHEKGTWSVSGRGGTAEIFGLPPLELERASATHDGQTWKIGGFAVRDGAGGALAGSATHEKGAWSGEFSWQDVDLARLLPPETAAHVAGKISGEATLQEGVLRGRAKLTGARLAKVPQFVKMASLFAGENWDTITWDVFRFDFVRHPDGRVEFAKLEAVSPQGIALHGAGHYAADSIGADFQLGVARNGRPWLVAFMPVLFRAENSGYLWTPVKVSGTPQAPVEDLSARLAAAVAVVPATTAIEAAAEIPGGAVEAAGGLLRSLLGR